MEMKLGFKKIMRRKLFCYTLFLMVGILTGSVWEWQAVLLPVFVLFFARKEYKDLRVYACIFVVGIILMLCFQFRFTHGAYHFEDVDHPGSTVSGIVVEVEKKDDMHYDFIIHANGEKILASYYQSMGQSRELLGQRISFFSEIQIPTEAGNPRTFDYKKYLLSQGIEYTCIIDRYSVTDATPSIVYRIKKNILKMRDNYMDSLHVSSVTEGILKGVLFGDKNQMEDELYAAFQKNGTAHVLAVSGLHIGMLYSIYRWIHEKWKSRWITIVFVGFLFIYGTAALWSVSVTRAVGLIFLVILGRHFDRRYDLLTALSVMAIFSMLKNPYVIFSAGFQMSFLAVLSITFLQKPFAKTVGERWAVAFAVQAGFMPYMAYTFNYISIAAILCNVPVIFLASIMVPAGISGFLWFLFSGASIPGLSLVLESVTSMMVWCNGLFTADGMLSFDVVSPPVWVICLTYGLLFFLTSEYFYIYFFRREWRRILTVFLLIAVCTAAGMEVDRLPFDKAELVFVDVGQGDCLHIKTPKGYHVLLDGGGKEGYNTGEKTLKPYLLKNRVRRIDLALATHLHTDHYAGLAELSGCYPVGQIMTSGHAGETISLEPGYWLEILWPMQENPDSDDENLNSLVFMVHHNGLKTLVTGDITAEGEAMLLDAYRGTGKLRADILKIAHHGSVYSTSDDFVNAVNPKIAVISVGRNRYGHPSEIIIEKLEKKGIMVFRTDLDGAVGMINRKGKISVCTEKQR